MLEIIFNFLDKNNDFLKFLNKVNNIIMQKL